MTVPPPGLQRRRLRFAALCCLATTACHEVPTPKDGLDAKFAATDDGIELERACTPSGVELCFDALDNNCNGIIDEGCGLHTGLLQFTIAWQESAVDIDLNVNGPDGQVATDKSPTDAGLLKDRDCPGSKGLCYSQNVENVFLAEGAPRRGRYRVVVRLEDLKSARAPIQVRLSARVGQRHFTSLVELEENSQQRAFEFTL